MFMMATKKPVVNIQGSRMIEGMLYELIPCLDKTTAKRLSRQLASLKALKSLDRSTRRECLKLQLKELAQKLLDVAERRRQASKSTSREVADVSSKVSKLCIHHAKVNRHHILINSVGESKYDEIISITEQIKDIRRTSAVWTKFSQQAIHSDDEDSEQAPVSQTLPAPIADVYFRTRLVDVMRVVDAKTCQPLNEIPEPCARIVQRSNWDWLLADAKAKLGAFRNFEMENFSKDDKLSFQCSSGMCMLPRCQT